MQFSSTFHAAVCNQFFDIMIYSQMPIVGGDSRMAVADGYPRENVIASDIIAGRS